jgi:very-short-patch-repair endonuclease
MDTATRTLLLQTMSSQHGLSSLDQMREIGLSRSDIQVAQRGGLLTRVGPQVYASPAAPRTLDFGRTLALLACPGALLSHQCAARLHDFDRFRTVELIEILVLRTARHAAGPFVVHSTGDLGKLDRVVVHGFRCTSGTRTVIDLAMLRLPVIQMEAAIDSTVRLGLSSPLAIVQRLSEMRGPGRWGAPLLDRLLLDSGGHTMLERRFLQLVRDAALVRPRTQVIFRRDGKTFARVDFIWDDADIVVEVSGRKGHSSPSDRARDAQRRNELQDLGFKVYEYTWEQVTRQRAWVIDTLRHRLRAA